MSSGAAHIQSTFLWNTGDDLEPREGRAVLQDSCLFVGEQRGQGNTTQRSENAPAFAGVEWKGPLSGISSLWPLSLCVPQECERSSSTYQLPLVLSVSLRPNPHSHLPFKSRATECSTVTGGSAENNCSIFTHIQSRGVLGNHSWPYRASPPFSRT